MPEGNKSNCILFKQFSQYKFFRVAYYHKLGPLNDVRALFVMLVSY